MYRLNHTHILAIASLLLLAACDKVSPLGVLATNTGTDDRVEMSLQYMMINGKYDYFYRFHKINEGEGYSFVVGADSHMTTDAGRLMEMFDIALDHNDLFCAHLGDIADTKAEYYAHLGNILNDYTLRWAAKQGYRFDESSGHFYYTNPDTGQEEILSEYEAKGLRFPLYVAVGNHDITHNGWAMFSDLFHTSFFQIYVRVNETQIDRFIFLDSANGTLGKYQIELIDNDDIAEALNLQTRNLFVLTHTNMFRPSSKEFASTYAREELYYLLNKFTEWNVKAVFLGHIHQWDERTFGGVRYITFDSMSERNNPAPGNYLMRVNISPSGDISYQKLPMKYSKVRD